MKDNLDIEELFQSKFNSFEGDVSPDAWANIQQGMVAGKVGATAAASKAGISTLLKVAIFSGAAVIATVGAVYLLGENAEQMQNENNLTVSTNKTVEDNNETIETEEIIRTQNENELVLEVNEPNLENEIVETVEGEENFTMIDPIRFDDEDVSEMADDASADNNTVQDENNVEASTNVVVNDQSDSSSSDINDNSEAPEKVFPTGKMSFVSGDSYSPAEYDFKANAHNFKAVKWTFGDGTIGEGENVSHTYQKPGTYEVKLTVIGNEEVYEETQVVIIQSKARIENIPNVITPNGDRMNDFFVISATEIATFYITVRDARGVVVFESSDVNFRWYGTDAGGNALDKARYTYMIFAEGTDGSEFNIPGEVYIK